MLPVSLQAWKALDSVKGGVRRAFDDRGANEFVAVIILIVIVIGIGLAMTPTFRDAIVTAFENIGNQISGATNDPGTFAP